MFQFSELGEIAGDIRELRKLLVTTFARNHERLRPGIERSEGVCSNS